MDARNFAYMFYGFLAAWLIVLIYVITLARRNARLKKELDDIRNLVSAARPDARINTENRVR
jgi:CcmD family protein